MECYTILHPKLEQDPVRMLVVDSNPEPCSPMKKNYWSSMILMSGDCGDKEDMKLHFRFHQNTTGQYDSIYLGPHHLDKWSNDQKTLGKPCSFKVRTLS